MRLDRKKSKKLISVTLMIIFLGLPWLSCDKDTSKDKIKWVTFKDIFESLKDYPPMNVGFDVDDTVLFSSPGYHYGQQKYSPGSKEYLIKVEFYEELNNALDKFSLPKECARRLINFHSERGDSIYFITSRIPTKTEALTELLAQTFGIENPNKIIFTGAGNGINPKIKPLKENSIQIFYGDSDMDIEAAQALDIRAIRVLRARNSTKKPFPKYGNLGEEVLLDSDY